MMPRVQKCAWMRDGVIGCDVDHWGVGWWSGNHLVLEMKYAVTMGSLVQETLCPHAGDQPANPQEVASFSDQMIRKAGAIHRG